MTDLLTQIESLASFSRDVDARIWCECRGYDFISMRRPENFTYRAGGREKNHQIDGRGRYTGRIDDAMALVRLIYPGCFVQITDWADDVYVAIQPGDKSTQRTASAKTMPLALMTALIKCGLRTDRDEHPVEDQGLPSIAGQASPPG